MWKIKRGEVSAAATSAPNNNADLRTFLLEFGASIESLIDATPFGVATPAPWSPATDKKKALLSNPVAVLNETTHKAALFGGTAAEEDGGWTPAPSKLLAILREGLANVAPLEEAFRGDQPEGRVPADVVVVPSDGADDAFVDLGGDRWGNTQRVAHPLEEAASEAKKIKSTVVEFLGKVQQHVSGLVVTSDDSACSPRQAESPPGSVPCDEDDFEDVLSVVTEIATDEASLGDNEDTYVVTPEAVTAKEDPLPKLEDQTSEAAFAVLVDEEDEWVMT